MIGIVVTATTAAAAIVMTAAAVMMDGLAEITPVDGVVRTTMNVVRTQAASPAITVKAGRSTTIVALAKKGGEAEIAVQVVIDGIVATVGTIGILAVQMTVVPRVTNGATAHGTLEARGFKMIAKGGRTIVTDQPI